MALVRGRCLSLCLSVCLSVCLAASHVPVKMKEAIKTLQHDQNRDEVFSGSLVFPRESLNQMEVGAKRVVLGEILEVYDKLIGQMLSQLPAKSQSEVLELQYLLEEVRRLKKHRYQKHQLVRSTLDQLAHIQTNNSVVQRKALWELPWLYDAASSLAGRKRRSLRRRQALKKRGASTC
ncbi:unnamed protein product [Lota lota]